MKKLFLLLFFITFSVNAFATPVTVAASTQSNFNPTGLSGDVTGIAVTVMNSSTTVTSSAAFRAAWVGLSGFRVSIGGTAYTVAYVSSQSSLTLTSGYAGATGASTMTLYKYVEVRFYSSISFRPLGSSEVIQVGTPGSGSWFKRFAAGIVNESGVNTLYVPQFIIESTTDSVDNNTARYTIGFYRPDNSLIQFYTCSGASQLRFPPVTPTSLADVCLYNSTTVIQTNQTTYTTDQINARFPSCLSGQMAYYAATGQNQNCLSVGSGLQITGATLSATGGGGGGVTGSGTTNYVPIWTSSSAIGSSQLFYDGANSRFQSQKDFMIYTTASSSKLLIDSDQVVLEGSSTRATSANMLTMKGVASQTGQFARFLDSSNALKFAVTSAGDVYPRGVTTNWPAANAAGVLTNNGSGTLTWSAATGTVTGTGTTNYLPIWTSASALGSSQMFYDSGNSRFQTQKDFLIFTTAANSRLLIDTSVTLEGSDTRAVGAHMLTLKGVTGQTGQYARFLDDTNALKFAVDADGDMYPRGVTLAWPAANAAGSLVNNGSGTLSWSAASVTGVRQAINVKLDYGCVGDGVTNDTTCINNALTAAASAATKQVYFPGGTYLTTGFTITGEISLIGDGDKKTVISSSTNAVIVNVVGSGATDFRGPTIEGMKIQGSVSAGSSQIGLKVDDGTYVHSVRIRNVTIANTGSNGLYVGNAYSSTFENMFITNTNAYPLLYNAANMPTNRFESIYIGDLRNVAGALTGFRIKAGDFVCYSCNGVNSGPTNSRWLSAGKKNGVDGDVVDSAASVDLWNCNLESWDAYGIYAYSGSVINVRGRSTFAGNGTAGQVGIYFDLTGNGSTYFSEFAREGVIEDSVDFSDGVAAYLNSQPIQSNGYPNFVVAGVGPSTGGGSQLTTYQDTSGTPASRKLGRLDGKVSVQTVTATTSITRPGVKYIAVNHTALATITIPWAGWYNRSQETLTIQDVSAAGANTNNIVIQPSTGTINGASTYTLNKAKQTIVLLPDGDTGAGNWRIVSISTATQPVVASGSGGDFLACWDSTGTFLTTCPAYRLSSAIVLNGGLLQNTDNANDWGASGANRPRTVYVGTDVRSPKFTLTGNINWTQGAGSPEGVVTADVGAIYSRNNGAAGTTLYVKGVGSGPTGWDAVPTSSGGGTPGGSGSEIQYRGGASTFSAVTSSSVSGGQITLADKATVALDNASTASVDTLFDFQHSSSGTPAAGFGGGLRFGLESTTTTNQDAAQLNVSWTTATHASRTALLGFSVVGNAVVAEVLRLQGAAASAVNYTQIINAATGANPTISVGGSDSNISLGLSPKGTGLAVVSTGVVVQSGSQAANDAAFLMPFTGGSNSGGPGVRWGSSASYNSQSSLYLSNGLVWQGANSTHDPFKIRTGTGTSSDGTLVYEFRPSDGVFNLTPSTGNTTTRHEAEVYDLTSTGTPGNGFGGQITYKGESSTTNSQQMGSFNWAWTDATHASRTSKVFYQTIFNAGSLTETWGVQGAQTYGAAEFDNGNVSGSVTINLDKGNQQKMRLTGNITTLTINNVKAGGIYRLTFTQDGTGSRTTVTPSNVKNAGGAIVLTTNANAQDDLFCTSDGTNLRCVIFSDVK